jgi:hypothetical protein
MLISVETVMKELAKCCPRRVLELILGRLVPEINRAFQIHIGTLNQRGSSTWYMRKYFS